MRASRTFAFLIPALLAAVGWSAPPASAAENGGRSGHLLFEVDRDGSKIGTHRLDFRQADAGTLEVDIEIALRVGLGPITLFRYEHTNVTRWQDGRLARMDAETNDDGDSHSVAVRRNGEGDLDVSTNDGSFTAGGGLLPSTYWMRATVEQSRLLNTQTGELGAVQIEPLGSRTVETPDGPVEAEGFEVSGDLSARTWYDSEGRWVKLAFDARGSEITYRLVEREGFVPGAPPAGGS